MINPLFDTGRILTWCESHRLFLAAQIEKIEAGQGGAAFTEAKRQLVELDTLLRDMRPAHFQTQVKA